MCVALPFKFISVCCVLYVNYNCISCANSLVPILCSLLAPFLLSKLSCAVSPCNVSCTVYCATSLAPSQCASSLVVLCTISLLPVLFCRFSVQFLLLNFSCNSSLLRHFSVQVLVLLLENHTNPPPPRIAPFRKLIQAADGAAGDGTSLRQMKHAGTSFFVPQAPAL